MSPYVGIIRPEIKYIKGPDNNAADTLSRLPLIKSDVKEINFTREKVAESYGVDQLDGDIFPLTYQTINKYQCKDKELLEKSRCANYHTKYFKGGRNIFILICKNIRLSLRQFFEST